MASAHTEEGGASESGELEFFGVKLKVKNARLAALLNSDVTEDVQVIGLRARDAFAGAPDLRPGVAGRQPRDDDSVRVSRDEVEDV